MLMKFNQSSFPEIVDLTQNHRPPPPPSRHRKPPPPPHKKPPNNHAVNTLLEVIEADKTIHNKHTQANTSPVPSNATYTTTTTTATTSSFRRNNHKETFTSLLKKQSMATHNINSIIKILSKPQHKRTNTDIDSLVDFFENFQILSPEIDSLVAQDTFRAFISATMYKCIPYNVYIFRKGDIADAFYFVLCGEAQIYDTDNDNKYILDYGSIFGEPTIIGCLDIDVETKHKRSTWCKAKSKEVLRLAFWDRTTYNKYIAPIEAVPMHPTYSNSVRSPTQESVLHSEYDHDHDVVPSSVFALFESKTPHIIDDYKASTKQMNQSTKTMIICEEPSETPFNYKGTSNTSMESIEFEGKVPGTSFNYEGESYTSNGYNKSTKSIEFESKIPETPFNYKEASTESKSYNKSTKTIEFEVNAPETPFSYKGPGYPSNGYNKSTKTIIFEAEVPETPYNYKEPSSQSTNTTVFEVEPPETPIDFDYKAPSEAYNVWMSCCDTESSDFAYFYKLYPILCDIFVAQTQCKQVPTQKDLKLFVLEFGACKTRNYKMMISLETFSMFFKWFKSTFCIVRELIFLCDFGCNLYCSTEECVSMIKKKPKGTFMLRLSNTENNVTLSYRAMSKNKKRCKHINIMRRNKNKYEMWHGKVCSLSEIVRSFGKAKYFYTPQSQSAYPKTSIF